MSRLLSFLGLIVLLSACQQRSRKLDNGDKLSTQLDSSATHSSDSLRNTTTSSKYNFFKEQELVPLQLNDSTEHDVYKRYSFDFAGNCYSCDVIEIDIKADVFIFRNACDSDAKFDLKVIKRSGEKGDFIEFEGLTLKFTEIVPDLVFN